MSAHPRPERSEPGAERARLFVALELPASIRTALESWRAGLVATIPDLRPIAPEALHVTLCFLGLRAVAELDAIASACVAVASMPTAHLTLTDGIWLPRRRPRVLAVALADPSGHLAKAQATISSGLQAGGFYQSEQRPFLAHVTVARVAKGGRVGKNLVPDPPELTFEGSTITLFRSHLSPRGARYEPLTRVTLAS